MKLLSFLLTAPLLAQSVAVSTEARSDFPLTADPHSREWKNATVMVAENDTFGKPEPALRTEIRSRWTKQNFYVLFVGPYQDLYSKPDPVTDTETNKLWDWDVAEIFIGKDFNNINLYKEFEVSPHGEWVDLDIDHKNAHATEGIKWNSGFHLKTRIDDKAKIWYCEMQIPWASIADGPPKPGEKFRINFYRIQGKDRIEIAWSPTHSRSFHVPEAFGILELKGR